MPPCGLSSGSSHVPTSVPAFRVKTPGPGELTPRARGAVAPASSSVGARVRVGEAGCRPEVSAPPSLAGIPRSYVEAQEDYLRREAKLLKREGSPPPPPPPRDLAEAYKARPLEALGPLKLKPAHEGLVATVKEAGRSIHEIPREELRRSPEPPLAPRALKEGSITQVWQASAPCSGLGAPPWPQAGGQAQGHSGRPGPCARPGPTRGACIRDRGQWLAALGGSCPLSPFFGRRNWGPEVNVVAAAALPRPRCGPGAARARGIVTCWRSEVALSLSSFK